MRRTVKVLTLIASALAVIGLFNACDKEECCSWTDDFGDRYMYCEDGSDWRQYYDSWDEVKYEATYYRGSCK